MNDLAESLALICIHSLWIGPLIALLLALILNLTPESNPRVRYAAAWCGLLGIIALSILSVQLTSPLPALEFRISPLLQNGIVILWITGFLISLLRFAKSYLAIRSLKIHSAPVTDPDLLGHFDDARARSHSRKNIDLRSSDAITGPVLIGWIFPSVVIPAAWLAGVPVSHLRAIFAHELAHAHRGDFIFNILLQLVGAVFFFNPAVWWIRSVIRREREHACDDFAAGVSRGATAYSRALIWFESHRLSADPNRLALAFGEGPIQSRISRLLRVSNGLPQKKLSPIAAISGASILAMTVLLVTLLVSGSRILAKSSRDLQSVSALPAVNTPPRVDPPLPHTSIKPVLNLFENGSRWQKPDPLFVSIPLVEKNGIIHDLRQDQPALFPEFPNHYVIANDLNYLNSQLPHLDPDGDGFTVMEEYQAGSDPNGPGDHPAFVEKLNFVTRQSQIYKIRFAARPDEDRFQLIREASAKWPKRSNFIVQIGEETADAQLKIEKFVEKEAKNDKGITIDASELTVKHLPSGKTFVLVRNIPTSIPTYYAELFTPLPKEKTFYVKEGDKFTIPATLEEWTLDEVKDDSCTISQTMDGGKKVTKTLKKAP